MRNISLKTKWYLLFCSLAVVIVFAGCTRGFDKVNEDPNTFPGSVVEPSFLLPGVYKASVLDPGMHQRMTALTNDIFAQYASNEGFSTQQGKTNDEWITSYYTSYHSRFIASLNLAIRLGIDKPFPTNDMQIARIWRCWVYARATDIWGDIPYFKASDGSGDNAPYDKQELIYKDMLKELKEAAAGLSTSNPKQQPGQDYVYNDDVSKWKKFANSLRLRLAMRVTQADAALAKTNAEEAIAGGIMTSKDDACLVLSSDVAFGWGNAYQYTYYYGWGSEAMSRSMENLLTGIGGQPFANPPAGAIVDDAGFSLSGSDENPIDPNSNKFKLGIPSKVDPRGPIYFDPSSGASGANAAAVIAGAPGATVDTRGRWRGTPAGLASSARSKQQYTISNQARLGSTFRDPNRSYEVMTYHEVCFLVAEAAQRGWAVGGGTTKSWYEKGITASMKWHGVSDATINAYLISNDQNVYGTTVNWSNNSGKTHMGASVDDPMSKIITQKYLGIFPDGGWEAWADHRRLHLPILIPFAAPDPTAVSATNGGPGNFMKRITYPAREALNNKAFYEMAISQQGVDLEKTAVWWDK